jgi:hypothetical protein
MVPLFIIFKQLGWINTFLPLVVPAFFGSPYFIFLLRQFFRSIPTISPPRRASMAPASSIFSSASSCRFLQTSLDGGGPVCLYGRLE